VDIAFAADKGGVGKTTLAYHVATRLRQVGADICLIDLDGRSASTAWVGETGYVPAYTYEVLSDGLPDHAVRVWDTPAHPGPDMRRTLAGLVDMIIIVAQPDRESQRAAIDLYAHLAPLNSTVRVLFNAFPPTSREAQGSALALAEAGISCLATNVRAYRCYQRAQWDERAVCDYPYPSADNAWADICTLTDEILETLNGRQVDA